MDIKEDWRVWCISVLKKKPGSGVRANVNEVLAQELHKPAIKKFKRGKVYARFKDFL